eukprot:g20690.t1
MSNMSTRTVSSSSDEMTEWVMRCVASIVSDDDEFNAGQAKGNSSDNTPTHLPCEAVEPDATTSSLEPTPSQWSRHPSKCVPCVFICREGGCPDLPHCSYCHESHEDPRWQIRKTTRDRIKQRVLPLLRASADSAIARAELQAEAATSSYVRQAGGIFE